MEFVDVLRLGIKVFFKCGDVMLQLRGHCCVANQSYVILFFSDALKCDACVARIAQIDELFDAGLIYFLCLLQLLCLL